MSALSVQFDARSLSKILRKSSVERTVFFARIGLVTVTALLLMFAIRDFVLSELKTREKILALQNSTPISPATAPSANLDLKKRDYTPIREKNIYGTLGVKAPEVPPSQTKPVNVTPLTLIGTFLEDGQAPYAIIEEGKKSSQDVYVVGDSILKEADVAAIYSDRVEIKRNGNKETLVLEDLGSKAPQFKDGVANAENDEYYVEEAELDKALENLPLLLTQARAVPYFKDGKAVGLRLFAIRSGSLFEKIGLLNGDILKSVNENSLADFSQALTLFEKLKQEKSIKVSLERNRQDREFKYHIK